MNPAKVSTMPRPPRLEFPGALYHVVARGNDRRPVFRDDEDRENYLSRLAHYRGKFHFRFLSYCLMTNHVHLAIRTADAPLSRIMAGLQSSYAQRFNRRHDRVGHLFQGRYAAFLVQEDRYLEALVRYIHRNPVEAGIVRRAADYTWSSDRFLRAARAPDWLDVDDVLRALGPTRRAGVRRYIELVDVRTAGIDGRELAPPIAQAVEGDEIFALERFAQAGEPAPPLRGLTEERVLEAVAETMGISLRELTGPRRGGDVALARHLAAHIARRLGGISVRRIARRVYRDDSSFVRPLAALESRLEADNRLRRQVDRIVARSPEPDVAGGCKGTGRVSKSRLTPAKSASQD